MPQGVARHWNGTAWVDLTQQGLPGPVGPQGPEGPPGAVDTSLDPRLNALEAYVATAGGTMHYGTGVPPANVGLAGDYWNDTAAQRLYGPKGSDTAWGAPLVPEYIASSTAANVASIGVPEGTQSGDMLIYVQATFGDPTVTPTNFTSVGVASGQYGPQRMAWKIADNDDILNGIRGLNGAGGNYNYFTAHTYRYAVGVRASATQNLGAAQPSLPASDPATVAVYSAADYNQPPEAPAPFRNRFLHAFGFNNVRIFDRVHSAASSPDPGYTAYSVIGAVLEPSVEIGFIDFAGGKIHSGNGAPPANIGLQGDYWHAKDLARLYGPKGSDTAWGAAATPDFRGATTTTTDGVMAMPTGTQVGDFLVARGINFTTAVTALSASWTLVGQPNSGNYQQRVYTKVATQADLDSGLTVDVYDAYGAWVLLAYGDVASMRSFAFATGTGGAAVAAPVPPVDGPATLVLFGAASSGTNDGGVGLVTRATVAPAATSLRVIEAAVPAGGPAPVYSLNSTGNGMAVDTLVLEPTVALTYIDFDPTFGTRVSSLETRVDEQLRYAGTYNDAFEYTKNDLVVHQGALYRAKSNIGGLPTGARLHLNGDNLGAVGSAVTGWGGYGLAGTGSTVGTTISGTKALYFDGNDYLTLGALMGGATAGEVFIALKNDAVSANPLWDFGTDTGQNEHYPYTDGSIYTDWGSTARKSFPTVATTDWHTTNISSAPNSWIARQNGAVKATITLNTVAFNGANTLGNGFKGLVAEVLIYDRVLTADERTEVETYLNRHKVAQQAGDGSLDSLYWELVLDSLALEARVTALESSPGVQVGAEIRAVKTATVNTGQDVAGGSWNVVTLAEAGRNDGMTIAGDNAITVPTDGWYQASMRLRLKNFSGSAFVVIRIGDANVTPAVKMASSSTAVNPEDDDRDLPAIAAWQSSNLNLAEFSLSGAAYLTAGQKIWIAFSDANPNTIHNFAEAGRARLRVVRL